MGIVSGFVVWNACAVIVAGLWLARHAMIHYALRRRRSLRSGVTVRSPDPAPRLTVLVAAKDEEENIEPCLVSLLAQDYPALEIIAIDDRSTDRTPLILDRLARAAPDRLQVVHVDHLPDGWFGKNHAMHVGVRQATGEYLCFIDADCRQTAPDCLTVAMAHAGEYGIDFLCLLPVLETPTFWERVLQPVCGGALLAWFPPNKVNKRRTRVAYANGMFMLLRRSAYERIGGHQSVRDAINEDIRLARRTKEAGLRLRVVENEDLYVTRMYRSFTGSCRGWARIFHGCLESVPKLVLSLVSTVLHGVLPFTCLLIAVGGWLAAPAETRAQWATSLGAWGVVAVLALSGMSRLFRVFRVPVGYVAAYPLGAVVLSGMLFSAILKTVGLSSTTWRGTTYHRSQAITGVAASTRATIGSDGAVGPAVGPVEGVPFTGRGV
jgi:glycosyltransferase involved in cell wall biosynthesis